MACCTMTATSLSTDRVIIFPPNPVDDFMNSTAMALKLQTCTQIPQRMQVFLVNEMRLTSFAVIALTGQLREQTIQPVQIGS